MITAGIDVGLEAIKIVIVKDGEVAGKAQGLSGGAGREQAVGRLWDEALKEAGIGASDVQKVAATGAGKYDVAFADKTVTEPIAGARAARYYLPGATSVVDAGASQTRVVTLREGGEIEEVALNQKCGAGLGSQLRYLARRLEMTLDEISALPPDAAAGFTVNDGCVVFIELDSLELLNEGAAPTQVAGAVNDAIAVRLNMILNDKITPAKDTTVLIGGVAKNAAVVNALKARSGIGFVIPADAEYGCALGCALLAGS
ncbi:MAG: acyl-CoA dehydratase activase [Peptococcaceae bacterium]|jgi:benzoyl-CoA reductase subunit D|nr:acyl-CoA dehydratase activase [Peptococcaceae bacterium]